MGCCPAGRSQTGSSMWHWGRWRCSYRTRRLVVLEAAVLGWAAAVEMSPGKSCRHRCRGTGKCRCRHWASWSRSQPESRVALQQSEHVQAQQSREHTSQGHNDSCSKSGMLGSLAARTARAPQGRCHVLHCLQETHHATGMHTCLLAGCGYIRPNKS